MSTLIEDYAIIGDTRTVAAVARNGSATRATKEA
jgi:hypothetical protein